jgi:hypothetical protein
MTCDLEAVPGGDVFRVARRPDPWAYPSWAYVGSDGTFDNRFDDPESSYRVLYACSQRLGAFIETLARFRPDPEVVAGLANIEGADDGALEPGQVPASWVEDRLIGTGKLDGAVAHIGHSRSLSYLRSTMASRLVHYGLVDLDAGVIRLTAPRRFTQEISRLVFECTDATGGRGFAGIRYASRLGDEFENWAVFEPLVPSGASEEDIRLDDSDLVAALDRLGITLFVGGSE